MDTPHKWTSLFLTSLYLTFTVNYTLTLLSLYTTNSIVIQSIAGILILLSLAIGLVVLPLVLFRAKLRELVYDRFYLKEHVSNNEKLEDTQWTPGPCYSEGAIADPPPLSDPLYHTIPIIERGEGGEQLYHPMHCIEATTTTGNNNTIEERYDPITNRPTYNNDDSSESESEIDLIQMSELNTVPPHQVTTPSFTPSSNVGGAWFDDMESNLCSPMTPPTYIESPRPPPLMRQGDDPTDDEIDKLYAETRNYIPAPSLNEQMGGDYVELKNNDNLTTPTCDPWYEEPKEALENYRRRSHDLLLTTPQAPPPLYSTIPILEDQFDDNHYSMIPKQTTPTKR